MSDPNETTDLKPTDMVQKDPRGDSEVSTGRTPARRRPPGRAVSQVFDTVESAATKLGLDANALRARCRRAAQRRGDVVMAQLGGGITAFKFGKSWRIRIPTTT